MGLNIAKGEMFHHVGYTWNPITGCGHGCKYCWAKKLADQYKRSFKPTFKKGYMKDKLPDDGKWIFIGSTGDMFCAGVRDEWIIEVLKKIDKYEGSNRFLFCTKNPANYMHFYMRLVKMKEKVILGTTIETTNNTPWSIAPRTIARYENLVKMKQYGFDTFLSLEPIHVFNYDLMVEWIKELEPLAIEIGKENYTKITTPPSDQEIIGLCRELESLKIEYVLKKNLRHLEKLIRVST